MKKRGGRLLLSAQRAHFILPLWLLMSAWMWGWWLNPARIAHKVLYTPLTVAVLYEFAILPTIFLYFILCAKVPPKRTAQKNKRVAVITLCVPSKESLSIIEKQIVAIKAITYPHDSWILDEDNSKEVKRLARKYGVKHFSRRGVAKYNQVNPPFKAKTKAGNVNAWLDHVKKNDYDFFVQLDIDHIPQIDYLDKTLGYFRDKNVAWVQAPSIYGNYNNWTARGAAEQELVLQGPLQMGFYGHSQTPFIIGSHCSYRMSAIRQINGFQPTRAEDHLDTVALSNKGYTGVFLPHIIAVGDGPETLDTYLAQQFAWAYSMFQVWISHTPKLLPNISAKKKLQFLFAQTWYPLWSLSYAVMFFTPIIALLINKNVMNISGYEFPLHFLPMYIATFFIFVAARPLMQPKELRLSWRGILLHAARWPVVLRACASAFFKIKKPYMITPKGRYLRIIPTVKLYSTFLILGVISSSAILFAIKVYGNKAAIGQMIFALINVAFMLVICVIDLNQRIKQQPKRRLFSKKQQYLFKPLTATISLALLFGVSLVSLANLNKQVTFAAARPSITQESNVALLPVKQLTDKEIINELSSKRYTVSDKAPTPILGVYAPNSVLPLKDNYIRNSFVDWRNKRFMSEELLKSLRLGATPLITIEPRGVANGKILLNDIASGKYDSRILDLLNILSQPRRLVYVRFAHEMELTNLYPWGAQDPELFKKAYRHFINIAREHSVNNIRWVWSPAGNDGVQAYYPGDHYVDVIGTTILYDQYWYGNYRPSFAELASIRGWLLSYGKPVWIVEFGVGNKDPYYQRSLIIDALKHYRQLGYQALLYLNIKDSNLEGPDYTFNNNYVLSQMYEKYSLLAIERKVQAAKLKKLLIDNIKQSKGNELNVDNIFGKLLTT